MAYSPPNVRCVFFVHFFNDDRSDLTRYPANQGLHHRLHDVTRIGGVWVQLQLVPCQGWIVFARHVNRRRRCSCWNSGARVSTAKRGDAGVCHPKSAFSWLTLLICLSPAMSVALLGLWRTVGRVSTIVPGSSARIKPFCQPFRLASTTDGRRAALWLKHGLLQKRDALAKAACTTQRRACIIEYRSMPRSFKPPALLNFSCRHSLHCSSRLHPFCLLSKLNPFSTLGREFVWRNLGYTRQARVQVLKRCFS